MSRNIVVSGIYYAYIRVSSLKQAKDGQSLETQMSEIQRYADRNEIKDIVYIKEPAKSANKNKREKRVELNALLNKMQRGDTLIVYTMSRLCRSVKDFVEITELLEKKECNLILMDKNVDTRSANGRFIIGMFALLGALELETTAERNELIKENKEREGKFPGKIPYGWKLSNGPNSPVIEVEEEQKIIQYIHDLKTLGKPDGREHTYQSIANKLNEIGIKPPGKSKKWYHVNIERILNRNNGPAAVKNYKKIDLTQYESADTKGLIKKEEKFIQIGLNFYTN